MRSSQVYTDLGLGDPDADFVALGLGNQPALAEQEDETVGDVNFAKKMRDLREGKSTGVPQDAAEKLRLVRPSAPPAHRFLLTMIPNTANATVLSFSGTSPLKPTVRPLKLQMRRRSPQHAS